MTDLPETADDRAAREAEEQAARDEIEDLLAIISTERGRRVVWRWINRLGMYDPNAPIDQRAAALMLRENVVAVGARWWHLMVSENER